MAATKEKRLTQAQKSYLVRRINEIANWKIKELSGLANYGSPPWQSVIEHKLDIIVLQAIIDGEIKLRSESDIMSRFKSIIANDGKSYFKVDAVDFINSKSLEKFNIARNKKAKAGYMAKQKRISSVKSEADNLKDTVMLSGSLAIGLLEKFEKKEF